MCLCALLAHKYSRKSQAAREAVEERQKRETLMREDKVLARNLSAQQGKLDQLTTQREKLKADVTTVGEKRSEVCRFISWDGVYC